MKILATLDKDSYPAQQKVLGKEMDFRMGDHPLAWSKCVGKGKGV